MSQHPSLKGGKGEGAFRSVLKRYEKIKELSDKDKWDEEKDSIYGLPKVKRIKFKVKKAKGPAEEKPEEAEAAAAEGVPAPGAAAEKGAGEKKPQAEAKKEEKK
ncbi:MAG: small basic protein [Candidatus Omnitrophica bacterium]|nr:small basic protein [Candidatus Omnitrophota bacterium]